jgi:predicted membrane protein
MSPHIDRSANRAGIGVLLILAGFLLLMHTLDVLDFGDIIANWWPLILIILGLFKLREADKGPSIFLLILGLIFLSATLDIISWSRIWRLWPLILIAIGISLVIRRRQGGAWWGTSTQETTDDFLRSSVIFGGVDRIVSSQNFQGGEITAIFGGADLDLRRVKVSPEGCTLNMTAIFGGVEIAVPSDWRVVVTGTPILGGIEDKTIRPEGEKAGPEVTINCTVAFGGIEIHN